MISPEQVPKESLVAYQRAFKIGGGPADGIAAALNAWPGMKACEEDDIGPACLILPLAQKQEDGDA